MPRSHQSSRSSSPSFGSSYKSQKVPSTFSYNAPIIPQATRNVSVQNQVPTEKRTFGDIVKEGFGFGMGNAIANRIFGRAPVVIQNNQSDTVNSTAPGIISSNNTEKVSHEDCMKEMYEKCLVSKSHEECKTYNPFDNSSEKVTYSKCMSDMHLECIKTKSSESCKKYQF